MKKLVLTLLVLFTICVSFVFSNAITYLKTGGDTLLIVEENEVELKRKDAKTIIAHYDRNETYFYLLKTGTEVQPRIFLPAIKHTDTLRFMYFHKPPKKS